MNKYKLIAFDMDGTLLDSNKQIRQDSIDAMKLAADNGKYICIATGRNLRELARYRSLVPMVEYLMSISGALIINNQTDEIIFEKPLNYADIVKIFELGKNYDAAIHLHGTESHMQTNHYDNIWDYGMGVYKGLFKDVCTFHDDIYEDFLKNPYKVYKFNFYCRDIDVRARLDKVLDCMPITKCYAEEKSLECSPLGISKASGLKVLCDHLGINISETIAVGDADNDEEMLRAAGLSVAMGNANSHIKTLSDVVVSDCDHGGIVEVIKKYLL